MRALEKVREAAVLLKEAHMEYADKEAEQIVTDCLKTDTVMLYRDNPRVPDEILSLIDGMLKRRIRREPLQYILGFVDFYGLKIHVGRGVLIPRPETELLIDEAIHILNGIYCNLPIRILDLCTGSGCIALVLAHVFLDAHVYAIDNSEVAIQYGRRNALCNDIKNVTFLSGSLYDPVKNMTFDMIVSNPPYIKSDEIADLEPEIKDWEPIEALEGGRDGLDYYRRILNESRIFLNKNGCIILEIGAGQAASVKEIADESGLASMHLKKDFSGIERIFRACHV